MRWLVLMVLMSFAVVLQADGTRVTRTSFRGKTWVVAEYQQGEKSRYEREEQITIHNGSAVYVIDQKLRQYVELHSAEHKPSWLASLAQWIQRRPMQRANTGKKVDVYFETVNTGERREFFGRMARHLITKERWVAEAGACEKSSEGILLDGWYLEARITGHVGYILTSGLRGSRCGDEVVWHGRPMPGGMAVLEEKDGARMETLELSERPLDAELFLVPAGYQKVERLPGAPYILSSWEQFQQDCQMLGYAVESWFR